MRGRKIREWCGGQSIGSDPFLCSIAIILIAVLAGTPGDTGTIGLKTFVRHNEREMRHLLALAAFATLAFSASADVIRCADLAGKISYTDGACVAGSRQVGKVDIPEVTPPTAEEIERRWQAQIDAATRADQLQRDAAEAVLRQPVPNGPVVIDSRGSSADSANNSSGNERYGDSRWSDRRNDVEYDAGPRYYPYPGGAYRRPPPRDMRPTLRNCGPAGCTDTQGNTYNRSGQLDRYRSLDGKTCRPIGTTTVCQ
jgi:hypothetical protein